MTSFSQPKKRTQRFSSIDSGELNLNINQENNNISNNNLKIENTICSLIDLISDNDLNFFYQDDNISNFKHNIDQLNLKFYLETEKILSSEGNYNNNKLFLILFKQINLYIKEIERLNSILINQAKEPNFLKKKMVIISQKKDNFETKELLIQTLKNSLKSLEKKLSKVIQSENMLKEQNEKLKKEIIHYKNLYENSMGISSISVSNSQNLNKKIKSKRTFSDNNKNNNNNNNYIVNNATINVNKNEYNLYEKPQKKNSSSKLKIIKAVKSKISYNSKKKINNQNNNNNINNNYNKINNNNNNYKILSNSNSGSNIIEENGNNKGQKISINITKVSNKGFHFHSNSNNLPKSNHDISFNMNVNNNNLINRDFEDIENLLIEIKDYFLEKYNNTFDDFNTLINENNNIDNKKNNNINISFDKVENKNKKYIIDVKPIIGKDIENNNNILTPHFSYSNKKIYEISHFENGNNE